MKGVSGAEVFSAVGFVEATNCGLVKFKQELNLTVDPRYSILRAPSGVTSD